VRIARAGPLGNGVELLPAERDRLRACESVIEGGLRTFTEVGAALLEVRDTRFYRESHGAFEEYCRERWGFARHYANRLIGAAEVVGNLVPIGTIPATESQARPLARLEPEQQREAWSRAVESASRLWPG
jgi:hypothetical protein